MKKILLTFSFAVLGFVSFGQAVKLEDDLITVSATYALPSEDFGATDVKNKAAGFAQPGSTLAIEYTHFFNNDFGGSVTLINRLNELYVEKMAQQLAPPGSSPEMTIGDGWQSSFLLTGFVMKFPISETNLTAYIKGNIGVALNSSPEYAYFYSDGKPPIARSSSKSSDFAYGYGAGIRYRLGNFSLGVESTWLNTRQELDFRDQKRAHHLNTLGVGLSFGYILNYSARKEL